MDEVAAGGKKDVASTEESGRRRSVGSLLRLKSKKQKEHPRDSEHSASETSADLANPAVPRKKSGFLRRIKKQKVKDSDTEPEGSSPPVQGKTPKASKAANLVRKLSLGRARKKDVKQATVADPETSDEELYSNASSTTLEPSEAYATPADTPPPASVPPPTPPLMEADEDQSDGPAGAGGGGTPCETSNPDRQAASEPQPVAPVTLPGQAVHEALQDDMKGDRRPAGSGATSPASHAHTGAIKKVPKGAKTSQSLVDEEKKSTRGQLLSITTPALQKQLNGQAAAAAVAAVGKALAPSTPTAPSAPKPSASPDNAKPLPDTDTPTSPPPPTTTEIRVIAEIGGVTPNGSRSTTSSSNGSTPSLDPNPPTPSSGDLMADARNKLSQTLGIHDSAQMSGEKREHLYKILVIGELGTGKTSIIKRYVHQFFSQHYRATIGVDFALKVLNWDASTIIRLQLWDIAGQERFGNMTRVYYKEAVGAFIVFDVTRAGTFDAVVKWKQDLDSKVQMYDGSPIPCVLLANKCDQQKEGLVNSPTKMDDYCKEKGFTAWFETSAKENVNIEEAARALVSKILQNEKLLLGTDVKDSTKIALDNNGKAGGDAGSSKSCAC